MTALAALALAIWLWLLFAHGRFWQAGPVLAAAVPRAAPPVAVIVPARNEAAGIAATLRSLLTQDYPGRFRVILVDDESTDGTGAAAGAVADARLTVLSGRPRPPGWSGKLWAVAQGVEAAGDAPLLLLTDADIVHDPRHLSALVARQEATGAELVSEMVALACNTSAERALVPGFVYFFQLLYPFAWVNDPLRATAAAAGGTMLVRAGALARIGGIAAVRGALIDDVALAGAIKRGGRIWLGHSTLARSVRRYDSWGAIGAMIARTAYVQLRFSPWRLAGTVAAMSLVFLLPPLAALFGTGLARALGIGGWVAMAASFRPALRRAGLGGWRAVTLPAVAAFYLAATLRSAWNHYAGAGVAWRGRAYAGGGG
ncbi:MAG: glycosyltransferase [Acetobacteraceae bacterium]